MKIAYQVPVMLAGRVAYWPYVRGRVRARAASGFRCYALIWSSPIVADTRTWIRRGALGCLAALLLAASLTGCTSATDEVGTTPSPTLSATPSPTESPTPSDTPSPQDEAAAAATTTYLAYWDAVTAARSIPDPQNADLARYAADTALANEQSSLLYLQEQGIVFQGQPSLEPRTTSVDLAVTPTVTIEDCVDSAAWRPVVKATGESAEAPGQSPRVPSSATVQFITDRWLVVEIESDRSRTC